MKKGKGRLDYVDIFRGLALLIMVAIQIFDYLSTKNIYLDPPYYVSAINSVTWVPPALLFTFVSGMSVWLLTTKLESKNLKKAEILKGTALRYGKYILISLPFTWFLWDFDTYFQWNEAIQGIGTAAILTCAIILATKSNYAYTAIIVLFAWLQDYARPLIAYDRNAHTITSLALNITYGGWFSLFNMVSLMLGGIIFLKLLNESKPKAYTFTLMNLIAAAILHFTFCPIDFYGRSFSHIFYGLGQSALLCLILYYMHEKGMKNILRPLFAFGKFSFYLYIGHYLLILKVLKISGKADTLSDPIAWLITAILLMIIYQITDGKLKKDANPNPPPVLAQK